MRRLGPSENAFEAIAILAIEAFEKDKFMTPSEEGKFETFEEYEQYEYDGWEETDYFYVNYANRIRAIAQEEALSQGISDALKYYEELKKSFWEEWGERHNIIDRWRKK